MNQAQNYYNSLSSLLSGQQNMVNTDMGMYSPALNNLLGIGQSAFGLANTGTQGISGLFNNYQGQVGSPMGSAISGAGASFGGLVNALAQQSGGAGGGG